MNTIIAGSRNIYLEYRFFINKTNNTYQYIKIYTKTLLLFKKKCKNKDTYCHSASLGVSLNKNASLLKSISWNPTAYKSGGFSSKLNQSLRDMVGGWPFTFQVPTNILKNKQFYIHNLRFCWNNFTVYFILALLSY